MEGIYQHIQCYIHVVLLDETDDLHDPLLSAGGDMLLCCQLVHSGYQCCDGTLDDILIHADTPVELTVMDDAYIGSCLRVGTSGNRMLFVYRQLISNAKVCLDRVADCIQTSVTHSGNTSGSSALIDSHFCLNTVLLLEVTLRNIEDAAGINIIFLEDRIDLLGKQFLMTSVGNTLYQVADFFLHGCRQRETKLLLQYECYAALTGYAVDTDNIGFVLSSHICGIDGQVRNIPALAGPAFLLPCHTFTDGILMGP